MMEQWSMNNLASISSTTTYPRCGWWRCSTGEIFVMILTTPTVEVAAKTTEVIMNRHRTGAAVIAASFSLVWAASSRAEPPPPMWAGTFAVPVVACDTKEQAITIANAGKESAEALLATYRQMSTRVDDKGDPTCANSQLSYLVVNEREDVGMAHGANGDMMHIWVVHGGTDKRDFWFIFAQPDRQTNA